MTTAMGIREDATRREIAEDMMVHVVAAATRAPEPATGHAPHVAERPDSHAAARRQEEMAQAEEVRVIA